MTVKIRSLGRLISSIYRHNSMFWARELEESGLDLGPGQMLIFWVIANDPGICQKEIAEHLDLEKATVTKGVQKLLQLEYIMLENDAEDGRMFHLYLAPAGKKILPKIKIMHQDLKNILQAGFDAKEKEILYEYLEKMNQNIVDFLDGKRTDS